MSQIQAGGNFIAFPSLIGTTSGASTTGPFDYVPENGTDFYVAENGTDNYVTES